MTHDYEALGLSPQDPDVIAAASWIDDLASAAHVFGMQMADLVFLGDGFWTDRDHAFLLSELEARLQEVATLPHVQGMVSEEVMTGFLRSEAIRAANERMAELDCAAQALERGRVVH